MCILCETQSSRFKHRIIIRLRQKFVKIRHMFIIKHYPYTSSVAWSGGLVACIEHLEAAGQILLWGGGVHFA